VKDWLYRIGRAFARAGLALNPSAYAAACGDPAMADPTYCGHAAPRKARETECEQRKSTLNFPGFPPIRAIGPDITEQPVREGSPDDD
jgi:hypothetical protein